MSANFACPLGTSLYCPSHYFELKGHCLEISRFFSANSAKHKKIRSIFCIGVQRLETGQIARAVALGSTSHEHLDYKASLKRSVGTRTEHLSLR